MQPIKCETCWKTMPKFTMTFILLTCTVSLGMIIACLVQYSNFNCSYYQYLSLTPKAIFLHGEVWRLVTCYFVNTSFWSVLYIALALYFVGSGYER